MRPPAEGEHFAFISIQIGRPTDDGGEAAASPTLQTIKATLSFSPHARILFDAAHSCVAVAKPWTRVAWTVEQAYADARGISDEVLRSGAAA